MKRGSVSYGSLSVVVAFWLVLSGAPLGVAGSAHRSGRPSAEAPGGAAPLQLAATLRCTVVDAASGDTMAARCSVTDRDGLPRHPPIGQSIYHTAGGGYFYARETFAVVVPTGSTIVRASRGLEYRPAVRSIAVSGDTSVVVALDRVVDLSSYGWYGGDAHVHIDHGDGYFDLDPEDALMMAEAEGLAVVNCLDNDYYFTGAPDVCSTERCIVYMSEEFRTAGYGHAALLGLTSLVTPFSSDWWPLIGTAADSAHAQRDACVVAAHPVTTDDFWDTSEWPGSGLARELPVDAATGRIDCFEVLSYSNCHAGGIELDLWYRLLNCGFTIGACAGTDATVNWMQSLPLGDFRVYASIPVGPLTFGDWVQALREGRSFVTSGPLITRFTVSGARIGETLHIGRGCNALRCTLSVVSASPLTRCEIVMNGSAAWTVAPQGAVCAIDTSVSVPIDRSAWIAARIYAVNEHWFGARDTLFAHTSPVHVTMDGERVVEPADAAFFADWITELEAFARAVGWWQNPCDSIRAFDAFAAAKLYYLSIPALVTGGTDDPADRAPASFLAGGVPNPFSGGTTIRFGAEPPEVPYGAAGRSDGRDPSVEVAVYDVRGRLVRWLHRGPVEGGGGNVYWDGTGRDGVPVPSGVYFCRLRQGARSWSTKLILVR